MHGRGQHSPARLKAGGAVSVAANIIGLQELQMRDVVIFPALPTVCAPPGTRKLKGCCLSAASRAVTLRLTTRAKFRLAKSAWNVGISTASSAKTCASIVAGPTVHGVGTAGCGLPRVQVPTRHCVGHPGGSIPVARVGEAPVINLFVV